MIYNNGVQYLNNNNNCGLTQDQQKLKLCVLIYQILSNQFISSISNTVKWRVLNDRKEFCRAFHINMIINNVKINQVIKCIIKLYLPGGNSNCFYQIWGQII